MLYEDADAFFAEPNKRITLMGMSNVGKTRLAGRLPKSKWFHYSVDYRIATAHLRESMIDILKLEMMNNPYLAMHLRDDAMFVDLSVSFSNLAMISHYLGKLGDPAKGGLSEGEFLARQARHRTAEIAALQDLPAFIARSQDIYGYFHFLNDASGSLCEVIDPDDPGDPVLKAVLDNTVLIYIEADDDHERQLVEGSRKHPKPLYYRPSFLADAMGDYLEELGLQASNTIDPDAFVRWIFPRLIDARRPRYEHIARHGYVVSVHEAAAVSGENDLLDLIGFAIDRTQKSSAHDNSSRAAWRSASSGSKGGRTFLMS